MDKNNWEIVKSLIDNFIAREEVLKELLEDKEKEIEALKANLKFYGE